MIEHPERIPNAVEELLRRFPVVNPGRWCVSDMDYKGVAMRAGDQISDADHLHGLDDRKFDEPMRVDFSRPTPIHSTFGNGAHRCPGSLLARTELKIFLEEWLKRIPDFQHQARCDAGVRAGVNATLYVAAAGRGRCNMSTQLTTQAVAVLLLRPHLRRSRRRSGTRHRARHGLGRRAR